MKYCSKCNIQFNTTGRFCERCGCLLTEVMPSFCPECGKKLESDASFCGDCGTPINASESDGAGSGNNVSCTVSATESLPVKRNIPKEAIIGVAVLLIALIGGGGYYFLTHNDKTAPGALTAKVPTQKSNVNIKDGGKGATGNTVKPSKPDNNKQVQPIQPGVITRAYHTTADKEGSYIHSASLAVDGKTETCWSEGVPGLGIGEHIVFIFKDTYKVSGLNIWVGHQKSKTLFYQNARPTSIRVEGSDGSSEVYSLKDTFGAQRVDFKKPINTHLIKIVVDKVSPGNKYQDTCIAEVSFF